MNRDHLRPVAVFVVWMVMSFLCHKLAKMAIGLYVDHMASPTVYLIPLIVTILQVLYYYSVIGITSQSILFYITVASHFLATLNTNASLALTFASSTIAIKMLEPVTSAVLQRALLKRPLGCLSTVGMVVGVTGALLYVGSPASEGEAVRPIVMAALSNLAFGVRNVAIKLSHGDPSTMFLDRTLRPTSTFAGICACSAISVVLAKAWVPDGSNLAYFLFLSSTSSACHATYSYVSTNVVLRYMSVVSHALANVLKRVLVVLLLYVSGRRTATPWNWAGLVICAAGMLLHSLKFTSTRSWASESAGSEEKEERSAKVVAVTSKETKVKATRLLWLLIPIAIVTITTMMPERITMIACFQCDQQKCDTAPRASIKEYKSESRLVSPSFNTIIEETDLGKEPWTELVSFVLKSNTKPKAKSKTDYALNLRFGYENWTDGKPLIAGPITFQPNRKLRTEVAEFLSRQHLVETPFDTDGLSPYLTTARDVINENNRVHLNIFRDLLRGKKYAVLFELAVHENKGDAAISLGELIFLERLGVKLLAYVNSGKCSQLGSIRKAIKTAEKYPRDEVAMLIHGGGNLIYGYSLEQCRSTFLPLIREYQQVVFSNSFLMRHDRENFERSRRHFCCNPNMTLLLRDRLSLHIAQRIFNGGTHLVLAPDMAMEIGYMGRAVPPFYDISWLRRTDMEHAVIDKLPTFPRNVSVHVWDWLTMKSLPSSHSVWRGMNIMHNGFQILQQGKVLITDRLHGHIMSVLLDIPHVLLDNSDQKLSSFHNTWTRRIRNCRLTDNAEDAVRLALELLEEYKDTLPARLKAADIVE